MTATATSPTSPAASEPQILARTALDALFQALRGRGYTVMGPTRRDGAIVVDALDGADALPAGWRDVQAPGSYRLERRDDEAVFGHVVGPHSPRRLFHVPEETLVQLRRNGRSFEAQPVDDAPARKLALFGVRACEIAALAIQDRVLMEGATVDPRYAARRADVLVIAVRCNEPGGTCFCTSMGGGPSPERGYDLSLTELLADGAGPHRFMVEVGSEAGAAILAALDGAPASEEDQARAAALTRQAAASMGRHLDREGLKELLYEAAEHPRWQQVAERCLTCANCTMVCPTCFCSRVDDVTSLDGQTASRVRRWDSCFALDFSFMHGGAVRTSVGARYRHWLTHKLASWNDQFDTAGCVGCGRCLTWCPAGIDITEEVAAIRAEPAPPRSRRPSQA